MVPGTADYTVGPSGDVNVALRPTSVEGAWVRDSSQSPAVDLPMEELSAEQFESICSKTTSSSTSYFFTYNPGWPLGTVSVYPVPSASRTLRVLLKDSLDDGITLNTAISMPPGHRQYFVYSLAIALAAEYGIQPPPAVVTIALNAKHGLEHMEVEDLVYDVGGHGGFDVNSGCSIRRY
jgi:hypothetical protein